MRYVFLQIAEDTKQGQIPFTSVKDNAFIHCDFLVVNSQKLVYRIYIKNYDYDDIFWKVMQMSSNSKRNDSLRAIGAFKAPSDFAEKRGNRTYR